MTSTEIDNRIQVAMDDLTLEEMAEVGELMGATLDAVLTGPRQPLAIAALAWIVRRRTDPTFTYEAAKRLRIADVHLITSEEGQGEAHAASNGGTPHVSPESGDSIPSP